MFDAKMVLLRRKVFGYDFPKPHRARIVPILSSVYLTDFVKSRAWFVNLGCLLRMTNVCCLLRLWRTFKGWLERKRRLLLRSTFGCPERQSAKGRAFLILFFLKFYILQIDDDRLCILADAGGGGGSRLLDSLWWCARLQGFEIVR